MLLLSPEIDGMMTTTTMMMMHFRITMVIMDLAFAVAVYKSRRITQ